MKGMSIGDFINPEDQKESWEAYIQRKKREEEGQLSLPVRILLVAGFVIVFKLLYTYLTQDEPKLTGS